MVAIFLIFYPCTWPLISWSQDGCSTSWHHISISGRKTNEQQAALSLYRFIFIYEEKTFSCAYPSTARTLSHGLP
jgi:hypothetical protein